MIRRYDFGTPIETGAVVSAPQPQAEPLPYFTLSRSDAGLSFSLPLSPDEFIFGLGESVRGVNKRGYRYRSFNADESTHSEDRASLYASHNLLIFFGGTRLLGVFFDDPGAVTFDLGYTRADEAVITSENGDLRVYLIEEDSLKAIVHAFRQLIGPSYIPPKWAFGYIQSRWGYKCEAEIRDVVRGHRERHIPLDGVCMDIDYMDAFKDFTVSAERFPDLPALCEDMCGEHIRLIPIIDAGVKQEDGYDVCDEGLEKGYFCTKEDGSPFIGAVWPGRSFFPDFLREDVRAWFGAQYARLTDAGIEGFWNDMNEPALFYTPEGLEAAIAEAESMRGRNAGLDDFFHLRSVFSHIAGNPADYRSFYQQAPDGRRVRHDRVHNLYGAMMTRAAGEGMQAHEPDRRHLFFSRSSYIGAHRYGGVWQGDNKSWWSHLLLNLKMMPSLNMCGFLYTGADLGGFGCNTTEDLLLRWLQLGVFTPLMRNHAALNTRDQEIYRFGMQEDMKRVLSVRYALLPYLYSEFMKCALTDECMFRPLAFDYPQDKTACRTEDQMMLGGECMIAPVYEQNARGRHVYLPEAMLMIRLRSAEDYDLIPMDRGHHFIDLALGEFPLFVRRGCFIPFARSAEWVEAVDGTNLTLLGWLSGDAAYALYDDDGISTQVSLEAGLTPIRVRVADGQAAASGEGLTLYADKLVLD